MPRQATYLTTIEDCLTISTTKLKEWGYFNLGQKKGTISWSRNGHTHSKIDVHVTYSEYDKFIILDYSTNGNPIKYTVEIIKMPSNLGKGFLHYFKCPQTNKICRKLYLYNGLFLHRTAFNIPYQKQIESKYFREMTKVFDKMFVPDEVYFERYSKYFKTHYGGKPTKRFLKLENKLRITEFFAHFQKEKNIR